MEGSARSEHQSSGTSDRPRMIAIITDVHANLPALEAALAAIDDLGCDGIVHTGDAIGIGPFPAETLQRLLDLPHCRFVMGNHDAWFAHGLPQSRPAWMSAGEEEHHRWVHAQLERCDSTLRETVSAWPWVLDDVFGSESDILRIRYQHYGLTAGGDGFASIVADPTGADLDRVFHPATIGPGPDVIFYGHHHPASDLTGPGGTRYINPGALGCSHDSLARFAVLRLDAGGTWRVTTHSAPYDRNAVLRAYDERDVPERDLIRGAFFGVAR